MTGELAGQKRLLRAELRRRRAALAEGDPDRLAARLCGRLRHLVTEQGARTLTCYLPVPGEPDTREFLSWATPQGIKVLLPISGSNGTLDWALHVPGQTVPGAFGIDEPAGPRLGPRAHEQADLMLIPAAAIDQQGRRLGWGRGYYDRALAGSRVPVYAIVHDHEVLEQVPAEPHDAPVDGAVTPTRTLVFTR